MVPAAAAAIAATGGSILAGTAAVRTADTLLTALLRPVDIECSKADDDHKDEDNDDIFHKNTSPWID